jgi:predicted transcriptional regulator
MIVSYQDLELRAVCLQLARAVEAYGPEEAKALIDRFAEIEASENADELFSLLGDEARLDEGDSLIVAIGAEYEARFVAVGSKIGRDDSGRLVLTSVRRMKLMSIARRN